MGLNWNDPQARTDCCESHPSACRCDEELEPICFKCWELEAECTCPKETEVFNMVFKVRYQKIGGHYHCDILSAPAGQDTFACLGALIMDERDFEALRRGGGQWLFESVDS